MGNVTHDIGMIAEFLDPYTAPTGMYTGDGSRYYVRCRFGKAKEYARTWANESIYLQPGQGEKQVNLGKVAGKLLRWLQQEQKEQNQRYWLEIVRTGETNASETLEGVIEGSDPGHDDEGSVFDKALKDPKSFGRLLTGFMTQTSNHADRVERNAIEASKMYRARIEHLEKMLQDAWKEINKTVGEREAIRADLAIADFRTGHALLVATGPGLLKVAEVLKDGVSEWVRSRNEDRAQREQDRAKKEQGPQKKQEKPKEGKPEPEQPTAPTEQQLKEAGELLDGLLEAMEQLSAHPELWMPARRARLVEIARAVEAAQV